MLIELLHLFGCQYLRYFIPSMVIKWKSNLYQHHVVAFTFGKYSFKTNKYKVLKYIMPHPHVLTFISKKLNRFTAHHKHSKYPGLLYMKPYTMPFTI